jgi:hypothetical protein
LEWGYDIIELRISYILGEEGLRVGVKHNWGIEALAGEVGWAVGEVVVV